MGWNDRMGFTSDEEVEAFLAAVEIEGNRKEEPPQDFANRWLDAAEQDPLKPAGPED